MLKALVLLHEIKAIWVFNSRVGVTEERQTCVFYDIFVVI